MNLHTPYQGHVRIRRVALPFGAGLLQLNGSF